MWHCRETGAAWRAILLDRRPHCARVAVMPGSREAPSNASAVLQGESPRHRAVGRGFPPSLKLRRTTIALAKVVTPADAGSERLRRGCGESRRSASRKREARMRKTPRYGLSGLDSRRSGAYDHRRMGVPNPSRASIAVGLLAVLAASSGLFTLNAQQQRARRSSTPAPHLALVDDYCLSCHDEDHKKGGLALDAIAAHDVARHPDVWEKVVRKLRARQMPPVGKDAAGRRDLRRA